MSTSMKNNLFMLLRCDILIVIFLSSLRER